MDDVIITLVSQDLLTNWLTVVSLWLKIVFDWVSINYRFVLFKASQCYYLTLNDWSLREQWILGAFHLEKKVRKFRCEFPGISLGEKVVPFCCKFRPCWGARCLKGHQNGGRVHINARWTIGGENSITVDLELVDETKNQSGRSNRENGTTFWAVPLFLGIFQSGEPKKRFSFSPEPEFSEFLTKWKAPFVSRGSQCFPRRSRATAVNISRVTVYCFPFDVIVFAMLLTHGKQFHC